MIEHHSKAVRIINIGLLICLFLIAPYYVEDNRGGEGLFLPSNITVWLVATGFIAYSLFRVAFSQKLVFPHHSLYLLGLVIGSLLSSLISGIHMPVEWLFRILFIFGGFLFLFGLFQVGFSKKQIEHLLFVIVLSTLFNAILTVAQIDFSELLPAVFLSSNATLPTGGFQQINTNASFLSTGLLIAFYLTTRPHFQKSSTHLYLLLIIFTIGVSSYSIFYSASRVGTLSVLIGFFLIALCQWKQLLRVKWISLLVILAFVAGGLATIGSESSSKLADKANTTFTYANARVGIYQTSLEIIKQKPVLGHGIGSFDKVFVEQAGDYLQRNPDSGLASVPSLNHPHNELLFWFIEGGLVAVFGILSFSLVILFALISLGFNRGGAYTAILFPIVLHTQVELPFYLSATHWFLFLFICFVILNHKTTTRLFMPSRFVKGVLITFSLLIFCFGSYFLVDTLKANRGISQYWAEMSGNVRLLADANQNLYFNRYAERSIMALNGVSSIAKGQTEQVQFFADWANNYLNLHPDYVVREILIKAYRYLGQQGDMCANMNKAIFLYPKNNELLNLNETVNCQ